MATNKHVETVEDLSDALDSLEEALAPVLNAPLSETLPKLDVLDKAKLQALLAYVTQDLVFMYLKTRGVEPATHPVMTQMAEVGKYFSKIKEAEDPAKRTQIVDKDAAKRFINAALSQSLAAPRPSGPSNAPAPATNGETIEGEGLPAHLRKTQKQIEREQRELEGSSSEDSDASDEEIKVIEEAAPPPPASVVTLPGGAARRQRQRIDPFAGYE